MGLRTAFVWTEYFYVTLRAFIAIWGILSPLVGCLDAASLLDYRFSEELPAGTMVGNVLTDFGTQPKFSQEDLAQMRLRFRRTDGNYGYFRIEEETGILRSSQVIDRESVCPDSDTCDIQLDVIVSPSRFFHIIKIVVVIEDINDQRPTFDPDHVSMEISEGTSVGSLVTLRGAIDRDSADYGVKRYELSPLGTPFELRVTRHRDGTSAIQLQVVESLDREFQDSYHVVVTAFDGGTPPKQGQLSVSVAVADSNDNAPLFDTSTYKVNLSEGLAPGSPVVTVHASDRDIGWNAFVFYSFIQQTESLYGKMFRIDNATGLITTKTPLQYHSSEDKIHLRVKATDGGTSPLFAIARVTVTVLDTNDNAPEITFRTLAVSGLAEVEEHAPIGSFAAHVKVHDADKGDSGKVTCRVSPVSDFFLDSQYYENEFSLLTARTFDREQEPGQREVIIDCEDRGMPPISSSLTIPVTIIDINDHSPQIKDAYRVSIIENNAVGALLLRLNATDEDHGANAELRYEMENPGVSQDTAPIVIDQLSGDVTANVVFNYEWHRVYVQRISVCDRGDPRRCASTTLTVEVQDVNDEPPIFSRATYYFDVPENQITGAVVGTVTAEDADANLVHRKVVYHLRGFEGYFDIDPDSGELRTLRVLDREEYSIFRGSVSAINEDFPSLRTAANIVIHVSDENDNVPTVISPGEKDPIIQVPCRTQSGAAVARVQATDPDDGPAGMVTYFLTTNSNFTPLFEIDPATGVITVTSVTTHECGVHWLTVHATDNGVPRRATLFDVFISLNASLLPTKSEMGSDLETSGLTSSKHDYAILFPPLVLGVVLLIVTFVSVFLLYRCYRQKQKKKEKQRTKDAEVNDEATEPTDTFNERMDFREMTKLERHRRSRSRSLYGSGRVVRYIHSDTESDSGCSASDESDKRTAMPAIAIEA